MATTVHPLPLPDPKLDPGRTGLSSESFAFVNISPFPICDVTITCWDDDLFGSSPEILPDSKKGVMITLFDPVEMPGDQIGIGNERPMPKSDWDRSDSDSESDETRIVFEPGKCIPPGGGFVLNLKFDETLDGNEGIEVKPSRILDGEHYGFGQDEKPREGPFTFSDLLKILGSLGVALPGLIGGGGAPAPSRRFSNSSRSIGRLAAATGPEAEEVASRILSSRLLDTPIRRVPRLHLDSLPGIDPAKAAAFDAMGIRTLADFWDDADLRALRQLLDLVRDPIVRR